LITYKKSGVNIDAGNELVRRIRCLAPRIGHFSGVYPFHGKSLVATCDGVGTKLKIAFLSNRHDTIGIDLVAMSANDLLCMGAKPLFFLDYFACGKLNVKTAENVVRGILKGCRLSGMELLGGETAEMPGFYKSGEYDLAGFAVGTIDKKTSLKMRSVRPGILLIGLPSSGLHSNGFSLVRKVFSERELRKRAKEFLSPTRIYVRKILTTLLKFPGAITGISHITGGGFLDNIPRILPEYLFASIRNNSWRIPDLFIEIQRRARLNQMQMFRILNMGIGMVLAVKKNEAESLSRTLKAPIIGKIQEGPRKVIIK